MTIEEKAKAYDEALERAKKYNIDDAHAYQGTVVKLIFPELAKSEDEKIRKEMIRYFTEMKKGGSAALPYDDCIAYLEKHKEPYIAPVPTPMVADERKPVECIDFYDEFYKVYTGPKNILAYVNMFVKKLGYIPIDIHELSACVYYVIKHIEEDTKASQKEQKPTEWSYPYGRNETADRLVSLAECLEMDGDCLFNGYSGTECGKFLRELARKQLECKPEEWGEEDEETLVCAISVFEDFAECKNVSVPPASAKRYLKRLKSLRPQSKKELSIEKAIKWLDDTFYFLDNSSGRGRDCEITTHDFDSLEEMYDSFRKAVIVDSEPHWKPTEEELRTLDIVISDYRHACTKDSDKKAEILKPLLEQLEKL